MATRSYLTNVVLIRVFRVVGVLRTHISRKGGSRTRRLSVPQVWKVG